MATEHINIVVRFGAPTHVRKQPGVAQIMRVSREGRGDMPRGAEWSRLQDLRHKAAGGGRWILGRKINRYTISGAQIYTFRRCNVFAVLQKILFSLVTKRVLRTVILESCDVCCAKKSEGYCRLCYDNIGRIGITQSGRTTTHLRKHCRIGNSYKFMYKKGETFSPKKKDGYNLYCSVILRCVK